MGGMQTRRTFLSLLSSLPFLRWLKIPKPEIVVYPDDQLVSFLGPYDIEKSVILPAGESWIYYDPLGIILGKLYVEAIGNPCELSVIRHAGDKGQSILWATLYQTGTTNCWEPSPECAPYIPRGQQLHIHNSGPGDMKLTVFAHWIDRSGVVTYPDSSLDTLGSL